MKNNSEKNVILARTDGIVLARHPNNHWYLTSCPGAAYRMRESSAMNVLNHLIPESERDLWSPLYLGDGKEDLAEEEIVPVDELVDVMKQLARQLLQWQQKSCVAVRFADRVEQELSQALDMEESAEDRDRLVIGLEKNFQMQTQAKGEEELSALLLNSSLLSYLDGSVEEDIDELQKRTDCPCLASWKGRPNQKGGRKKCSGTSVKS